MGWCTTSDGNLKDTLVMVKKGVRLAILFTQVSVSMSAADLVTVWIDTFLIWASVYSSLSDDIVMWYNEFFF